MNAVKFIKNTAVGEIVEKKSRFIATITPVKSEEEALAFVASMKKKYYDARHNCHAYIIGDISRSSDDGEPAHTAGRPMLDVLNAEGLDGICAVVTRYFGGILLGTGGLVRAYQGALRAALSAAEYYSLTERLSYHIDCDYTAQGKIAFYAESRGCIIENTVWSDRVVFDIFIDPSEKAEFEAAIQTMTGGKAGITENGLVLR